jgi:anaerobic magnesium-protoporphyrin IX monomethyl ester cyclase
VPVARVLLIRPGLGAYYTGVGAGVAVTTSPPVNLSTLAAVLLRGGHQAWVWDLEASPRPALARELTRLEPDIVGFTFRTPQWHSVRALVRVARNLLPDALLVAGGPHASSLPAATLEGTALDLVVRGEGEAPLLALADGADPRTVPGVVGHGFEGPPAQPVQPLDSLPMPAWHLYDMAAYRPRSAVARQTPAADLESSRGCLASCLYCTKAVFGRRFEPFSPDRFTASVLHAQAAGFRSFNLVDDSFTTDRDRAVAICEQLAARGAPLPWTATNGIRVTGVDEPFFRLAHRAGCRLLAFGLESGSDERLRAIGKGATTAQARRAVQAAHAAGITTVGYFMLGLPGETPESLQATLDFACSLPLDWAKFALTLPLPGTPLWQAWRGGLKLDFDPTLTGHRPPREWFEHPDLDWDTLERARRRAYLSFYGRPAWVARRLQRALRGRAYL